ncbi:acyltransferase family protein [Bradyrhizobium japonicum]|uniref:acyltransferase family protein n=1 Tax=Bradyrhizobium japonicum TaxID=375 RepID=UPI00057E909B|nr:acyltransferase [Bradyrhizobium japonicum]MBR0735200.1 acyltransferase [Bradyrhizobium japonicum]MCD9109795.1 acyltransferase [Bradyrhizobium japonicum]MCD9260018.1 acyltransferase [Bradyrhizobium japonicum SEMIA 5079]MCD9823666.1 acyltransferase [Bradyrhizobium japonicum]MCD9898075.1 acyltransferase [Bradyrhizobium japonicum]
MSEGRVKSGNPIQSIQVMRGLASVSVVAFHVGLIMAHVEYGGLHPFGWIEAVASRGWFGVNFFFVLSGFIIFLAHAKDIGKPRQLTTYLWRRFSRIYPAYWAFLTLFIAAAFAGVGKINFGITWGDLLSSYTLLRWVNEPSLPLKVAWTLLFEVLFYCIFAIAILNRAAGAVVLACWFVAIMISSFLLHSLDMGWMSMWNINFFFGMLAYLAYRQLPDWLGLPIGTLGIFLLVALAPRTAYESIEAQQGLPKDLLALGVPFFLILLGFALAERRHGFVPSWPLLVLGEASYAIYLVHSAAISILCQIFFRFQIGQSSPNLVFWFIFPAAVVAGVLAHFLIERPLTQLIRRGKPEGAQLAAGFR